MIEVTDDLEAWHRGEAALFSTIKAFKGLEAEAVIVVCELPGFVEEVFEARDLYVACSRAKHELAAIVRSAQIAASMNA